MNLLVISDLHLGAFREGDIFGWKSEDFLKKIESVVEENGIDKIVLNGDIFELYKYDYKDICLHHKKLLDYFYKNNAIFIKGNHDTISDGREAFDMWNRKGQSIHIEHGHDADFLSGTALGRWYSKWLHRMIKQLSKKKFLYSIYLKIVALDDEINRIPRKYNSYTYLKYALNLLKKYDVVILGHTHKIETHKTYYLNGKKLYLNCGSCSMGRFQAVTLDTETLRYEIIKLSHEECTVKSEQFKLAA